MRYFVFASRDLGFHTLVTSWFLYSAAPVTDVANPMPSQMAYTGVSMTVDSSGITVCNGEICIPGVRDIDSAIQVAVKLHQGRYAAQTIC